MELVLVILFLGGIVVICAPVFDGGHGCGTLALMFLISTVIMAGLVALAIYIVFRRGLEEMGWIDLIGGMAVLIIGIVLANRIMVLFFDD